ncbi:MAG: DUF2147 domain-containing protein [Flavobacteriaceae bacterium]
MKHIALYLLITVLSFTANAQTIVGQWETYDDKTKEKKALIEIYNTGNRYSAKIIKSFVGEQNAVCKECEGDKKNKPIIGLIIIEDLIQNDTEYNGGTILDPESGEVYSCNLKLINANKLKVRGFIGFSLLGRTQYWRRKL